MVPTLPDDNLFDYAQEERELQETAAFFRDAEYAGFWVRAIATVIDIGLIWVLEVGTVFALWETGLLPITEKELGEGLGLLLALGFWIFPAWPYFALLERSKWQGTLGKRIFGLRVVDLNAQRIGFLRATGRHAAKGICWLMYGLGFVLAAFTERKRGVHDFLAGTLVVWAREPVGRAGKMS